MGQSRGERETSPRAHTAPGHSGACGRQSHHPVTRAASEMSDCGVFRQETPRFAPPKLCVDGASLSAGGTRCVPGRGLFGSPLLIAKKLAAVRTPSETTLIFKYLPFADQAVCNI